MAEGKDSFVLYADLVHTFENLTDLEAGRLIKIILDYINDRNPKINSKVLKIAFEPIKQQLKRDLRKWEKEREGRSIAGKKGMESRWKQHNEQKLEDSKRENITNDNSVIPPITNITNITDNVTVPVTVNVNDIELKKEECEKTVEFCHITLHRKYGPGRVTELWKAFLIQNEKSFHKDRSDRIRHFQNWIKIQPEDGKRKQGTSEARIDAIKNF